MTADTSTVVGGGSGNAGLYDRHILPWLITKACTSKPIMKQRAKVAPAAHGDVLELGIGGGLNLAFYDPAKVTSVEGLDPSPGLRALAQAAPAPAGLSVTICEGVAEALPFEPGRFDTVVFTYTLCSVHNPIKALEEARRVLKPGGRLLFCEHGLAPDPDVIRWQRRLEPLWVRIAGGCHLTRPVTAAILDAGFKLEKTDKMYLPGTPRFAGWNEWGVAVKA